MMGYDPATNQLFLIPDPATHQPEPSDYNLATIQGGGEVAAELTTLLDDPTWQKIWLQYCRLRTAPPEVITQDKTTGTEGADGQYLGRDQGSPRLDAYAYYYTKNPVFARAATASLGRMGMPSIHQISGPDSLNPVDESSRSDTNGASQSSLNAIEVLALCADQLPTAAPKPGFGFGRGNGGGFGGGGPGANGPGQAAAPAPAPATPAPSPPTPTTTPAAN
jgi:hypothetical protein